MSLLTYTTHEILELFSESYQVTTGEIMMPGSREHAEASVFSYVLGGLTDAINAAAGQALLSTATGPGLDAIADTWGVRRPVGYKASAMARLEATGIPGGIYIAAGSLSLEYAGHVFRNVADIDVTDSAKSFSIQAENPGADANNIPPGALSDFRIDGYIPEGMSATNTTRTAGGTDGFPDTAEGDEAFRAYIRDARRGASVGGPAWAYEARAMSADSRVLAAYCLRDGDTGAGYGPDYVKGIARISVILADGLTKTETMAVMDIIQAACEDEDFRPIGDRVICQEAPVNYDASFDAIFDALYLAYPLKFKAIAAEHFVRTLQAYSDWLRAGFNRAFSESELSRRLTTPDASGVYALEMDLGRPQAVRMDPGAGCIFVIDDIREPENLVFIDTGDK